MSKIVSTAFLLLISLSIGYSQQRPMKEWLELGQEKYAEGNFPAAFEYYKAALKYRPNLSDSLFILVRYAESARRFNAFATAEEAYKLVLAKSPSARQDTVLFGLASVELQQEKYDSAIVHFNQFLAIPSTDPLLQAEARLGVANAEAARRIQQPAKPLEPTRLPRGINESNAEYLTDFLGDTLIYSTLKDIYRKDDYKAPRKYTEVYKSIGGQPGAPWKEINEAGKHVSNVTFNRDQTRMYYTICEYKDSSVIEVRCDVYLRERDSKGNWVGKKKLAINDPAGFRTTTQPALAYDTLNKREWLFFVTDQRVNTTDTLPHDLDIWSGLVGPDGDVTKAAPVAALNSEGDEASPAYYQPTQTLFFSSNRRSPGFGGFDVYEADMDGTTDTWTPVKHLPKPINSGYDELHFALRDSPTGTDAYYSSNVPSTENNDAYVDADMKACCWDVFQVDYQINLQVKTFLLVDGKKQPLNGATLVLQAATSNSSTNVDTLTQATTNSFFFTLLPNKTYTLQGTHPRFNTAQTVAIVADSLRSKYIGRDTLYREFVFAPLKLLVNTFKARNGAELDSVQVTLQNTSDNQTVRGTRVDANTVSFEVQQGKQYQIAGTRFGFYDENAPADLRGNNYQDSVQVVRNLYFRQELEVLVFNAETSEPLGGATVDRKLLTNSSVRNLEVRTNEEQDNAFEYDYTQFDMTESYRLVVSRQGYQTETVDVSFDAATIRNSRGKFSVRVELSPTLPLYFDNDIPGPSSRTITTTSVAYGDTYEAYFKRKAEFISFINTAPGYSDNERFLARSRYETIFDQELRQGFQQLQELSKDILTQLQQGNSVEVTIEAFCSPLGSAQYNLSLGKRRIDSVLKHFLRYDSGKIAPYYRNKKFKVIGTSNGESKADPRAVRALSGSGRNDRRKGIFDIWATLERRVVITDVKVAGPGVSLTNYNLLKNKTK